MINEFVIEKSRKRVFFSNKFNKVPNFQFNQKKRKVSSLINPQLAEKLDFVEILSAFKKVTLPSYRYLASSDKPKAVDQNYEEFNEFAYWMRRFNIDPHIVDIIIRSKSREFLPWPDIELATGTDQNYPGLFDEFSPTSSESERIDIQKSLLSSKLFKHYLPASVSNGTLRWVEDANNYESTKNRKLRKDTYLRSIPSIILDMIHKKRILLDTNAFDMLGRSQDPVDEFGYIVDTAMNHLLVPVHDMNAIEEPNSEDIPQTDLLHGISHEFSLKSQALDALLGRHLEGVIDSFLQLIFDTLDPVAEELGQTSMKAVTDNVVVKNPQKKDGNEPYGYFTQIFVKQTDLGSKLVRRGDEENFVDIAEDCGKPLQRKPKFNWQSLLLALESAIIPLNDSTSDNISTFPDELPNLHFSPAVMNRIRNRLNSLFVNEPLRSPPSIVQTPYRNRVNQKPKRKSLVSEKGLKIF